MAIECEIDGESYVFEVDYGEESETARIIVRCAAGGPEGLFLVKRDGTLEPAEDFEGFGPNPVASDGLWPWPPEELVRDGQRIAEQKGLGEG